MIKAIKSKLFSLQDTDYKNFTARLIPNTPIEKIIGVRTPLIRKFAKEIVHNDNIDIFLNALPHDFHEENLLHALIINECKDFNGCIAKLNVFLPFTDNWAVCDSIRPKIFNKSKDKLLPYINEWISSNKVYTVRFGIECLMVYYLDDEFEEDYLKAVGEIVSDEYYLNMMIAWYFATALAKQWECTLPYIEQKRLPTFVHNKTIQKATESYRITNSQKDYLKSLKI